MAERRILVGSTWTTALLIEPLDAPPKEFPEGKGPPSPLQEYERDLQGDVQVARIFDLDAFAGRLRVTPITLKDPRDLPVSDDPAAELPSGELGTAEEMTGEAFSERYFPFTNRAARLALRVYRARAVKAWHDELIDQATKGVLTGQAPMHRTDHPFYRVLSRTIMTIVAREAGDDLPEVQDGITRIVRDNDFIHNLGRLFTQARQANPRGSSSAYQALFQLTPVVPAVYPRVLNDWHALLWRKRTKDPDPRRRYGYPRDSNSGPVMYMHGAAKGRTHNAFLDSMEAQAACLTHWQATGDANPYEEYLRQQAFVHGAVWCESNGERHQANTSALYAPTKGALDGATVNPKKKKYATTFDQMREEVVLAFRQPEWTSIDDMTEVMRDAVTSKSRNVDMINVGANGMLNVLHKPFYVAAYSSVASAFKSAGPGTLRRAPQPGRVRKFRRWDVRRMDQQLPASFAHAQSQSRVRNWPGYPQLAAATRLLLYCCPRILPSDVIDRAGLVLLARPYDIRTFMIYAGMPTGAADGSDTHSETAPVNVAVRQIRYNDWPEAEAAQRLYDLCVGDAPGGARLHFRGDAVVVDGPSTPEVDRLIAAIDHEPVFGADMLDFAPADRDSFDGEFPVYYTEQDAASGEPDWIPDFVGAMVRLLEPERSPNSSMAPGASLESKLNRLAKSKKWDVVRPALDRLIRRIVPSGLDGAIPRLKKIDVTQELLSWKEQLMLDNPSDAGRWADDEGDGEEISGVRDFVWELVRAAISADTLEGWRKTAAGLEVPIPVMR